MAFKLDKIQADPATRPAGSAIEKILQTEITLFGSSFNSKKKQAFYQELAVLLNAGITIKESLSLIIDSLKKKKDADLIREILSEVVDGKPLSRALLDTKAFSEYEFYSIQIGEETGTTTQVCHELEVYYGQKNEQRRIVIAALTYPGIVLTTAIIVVVFMLNYVVPMFQDIFRQNNMELPILTKAIVKLSQITKSYGLLFFFFIAAVLILTGFMKDNKTYKSILHNFLLKMPIVGPFTKKVYLAQFTQAVALLTTSKVPVLNSVQMVKKMIRFVPLQDALELVEQSILKGNSLSASLKLHPIFDNRIVSLVKVAEETNQTEYVFKQLSLQYNQEVVQQSKIMTTVLEPLIIVFIGGLVAILLIAMYLPMFQLSSAIGG